MNLFRRIFSQPPNASLGGGELPAAPVKDGDPGSSHKDDDPRLMSDASPASEEIDAAVFRALDGATRPLPQETMAPQFGNDHLIFGQATDVGVLRPNNQDAMFSFFSTARSSDDWPDFGLFIVADGMGGHHDGEKASAITTRVVSSEVISTVFLPLLHGDNDASQMPLSEAMVEAVQKANAEIVNRVPEGGTTVTAVAVIGDLACVAHVGDSRVYQINHKSIEKITRDHSLVQRLIELDQLTPEEASEHPQKNVLYRALGQADTLEVDISTRRLPPGSHLLICSDGLWNQVPESEIKDIIAHTADPQEACNQLVALANNKGGIDNVTMILLRLPG